MRGRAHPRSHARPRARAGFLPGVARGRRRPGRARPLLPPGPPRPPPYPPVSGTPHSGWPGTLGRSGRTRMTEVTAAAPGKPVPLTRSPSARREGPRARPGLGLVRLPRRPVKVPKPAGRGRGLSARIAGLRGGGLASQRPAGRPPLSEKPTGPAQSPGRGCVSTLVACRGDHLLAPPFSEDRCAASDQT